MKISCHLCGSLQYKTFANIGKNKVVICKNCGFYYVNPTPTFDVLHHHVKGSNVYTNDQLTKYVFFRQRAVELFDNVQKYKAPGHMLDVGCAIGAELEVARERGWNATGIELSSESVKIGREKHLNIIDKPLEECLLKSNSFELITLNHVLEHITEYDAFFNEIVRISKKDSLLYITIPNLYAWKFFIRRSRYSWNFHEDHFAFFSIKTLTLMLNKHGYEILEIRTSRWLDFTDGMQNHGFLFKLVNSIIESLNLGIEIICIAKLNTK
ncbi:MAG: hypothetical protein A2351_05535 [Omnitrophica bacterium RIFOXYB12_FULL_50_7]|nr:MAG: hypothetical protein A2351_05535 [Omnitrophica bacterium RIFOXYB12_FULL_50_7]